MAKNKATLTLDGADEIVAMLDSLPKLIVAQGGPVDRAVSAGSKPIAARARQLAPDSSKTNSRDKQSKKVKGIWTGKLKQLIRVKLVRYQTSTWSVVGPKSKEGNMSHFQQETPRRLVLWGKATRVQQYRIARNWTVQAFDETRGEQLQAMKDSIQKDIEQLMGSR